MSIGRWTPLAVLFVALAAGCGDKKLQEEQIADNAKKLTADSTTDATQALVDEGYRFRMEWPGEGWKLLGPAEAKRIVPDAVAGAVRMPNTFVVVIVEPAPNVTPDQLVDMVVTGNPQITDAKVESRETIQFAGVDARRVVWTGSAGGMPFRWASTVFVHGGHGYQVLGWGPPNTFQASALEPVWRGFSILPGDVVGPPVVAAPDGTGPGWRVAGGAFESAVSGLRVQPVPGWRVITGRELARINDSAEVAIEAPAIAGYIAVIPERIGAGAAAQFGPAMVAQVGRNLGSQPLGEWTGTVAGESVVFTRFEQAPLEFLIGTRVIGDIGVQVLAWYPKAARDKVYESLGAAVAGISTLDPTARSALRTQLASARDPQSDVGATQSLRGGVFREFAAGVVWRKPKGFWRLRGGDDPTTPEIVEALDFDNVESGLMGYISCDKRPGIDPAAWHGERVARITNEPGTPTTIPIAKGEAMFSRVAAMNGDLRMQVLLGTVVNGDYAIELTIAGTEQRLAAADAEIREVFAALETAPLQMTGTVAGEYFDERLGFAVRPPEGWAFTDETGADKEMISTTALWRSGKSELRVLAMNLGEESNDTAFMTDLIEQGVREELTKRLGAATEGTATLAGLPAKHSKFSSGLERADVLIASRDDTVLVVISVSLDDATLESVVKSVRLLD